MAAPESLTTLDLTGKWTMNKSLSDSTTDEILRLQGISWLKRKAISIGTVYISFKHYKDADDVEHIDIDQTVAGIPGSREERTLWWKERSTDDSLFGPVVGKSRRAKLEDIENEYLTNGWTPDTIEQGLIQTYVESDTPKSGTTWIAEQTWGFEEINGERRYVRHVQFIGPKGEDIKARLVYDYLGPLQ